jgi:predicted nuclease of predicted toxin-antitoxin system
VSGTSLRLLLDEDVRVLLAGILRERGHDVAHVLELGRQGLSDSDQLAFAARECRAILTHNIRDFVLLDRDYKARGRQHHGILLSDQVTLSELLARTLRCLGRESRETVHDQVVWLHTYRGWC